MKLGQIGDVVMAIPAARALHDQGYAIEWMCGATVAPLLACYSWITPVPIKEKAVLGGAIPQRLSALVALWSVIGGRRYSLCVTLYYDQRYGLLTWPIRATKRIALSGQDRTRTLVAGRHHTDEAVRAALELEDTCREQSHPPVRPDRLPRSPLPRRGAERRIALAPGAAGNLLRQQLAGREPESLRRWPLANYVAMAYALTARGWEVLLLGGADETWVRPSFEGIEVIDCLGTLSLPEVVSVCDDCDAVIANDSGPMHLAGLSQAGLIGIFGPTDPGTRLPRRKYSIGVWGGQGFACRPCYDGRQFPPCRWNGCMHQVGWELVLEQLDILLADRAAEKHSPWRVTVPVPSLVPDRL